MRRYGGNKPGPYPAENKAGGQAGKSAGGMGAPAALSPAFLPPMKPCFSRSP